MRKNQQERCGRSGEIRVKPPNSGFAGICEDLGLYCEFSPVFQGESDQPYQRSSGLRFHHLI